MARAAPGRVDVTPPLGHRCQSQAQAGLLDRLLATLVYLRHATTHDVLACWFGVDHSTITCAIGEVRPLLAERGCTVAPDVPSAHTRRGHRPSRCERADLSHRRPRRPGIMLVPRWPSDQPRESGAE
ncbi:transposase family protein [Streptomyces albidoflavus]